MSMGWHDHAASLTDLIFRATTQALGEANVDIAQVDSVVLSAHDLVDGRSLSSMVTAPAAGAYLRDEIRLAEDGLAAMSLASARIEAGETEFSIVAAWGRASEGNYLHTSRFATDPFLVQPFSVNEFEISSLRLSAWIGEHGDQVAARLRAQTARCQRAARNPRAISAVARPAVSYPMMPSEAPRFADIVVVAVIGAEKSAVRIAGVGHSTEVANIGERGLSRMHALQDAVHRARAADGSFSARLDVVELAGPCLTDEAIAVEAIKMAAAGEGFDAYASLHCVNPSGGSERGWCFPASGLLNLSECYLQLVGKAAGVQVSGAPSRALATGLSPMGGQVAHAVILATA